MRTPSLDREYTTDETEAVLAELAELEVELGLEIARLRNSPSPTGSAKQCPQYLRRPLWWWRFKLLCWTHSQARVRGQTSDLLAGLRTVMKDLDDGAFLEFLHQVPMVGIHAEGRRPA